MDSHTDSRNINRLEIIDTGRRRRWSDEAKLRIVEESFSGPRLASATARRHGISNPLLFAWRKAYREGRLGESVGLVPAVMRAVAPITMSAKPGRAHTQHERAARVEAEAATARALWLRPYADSVLVSSVKA